MTETIANQNNSRLKETAITLGLSAISLPAATVYYASKYSISREMEEWRNHLSFLLGVGLTLGATFSLINYQERNIAEINTSKIEISRNYSYRKPTEKKVDTHTTFIDSAVGAILASTTNYYLAKFIANPPREEVTNVKVRGYNKGDVFNCSYQLEGFQDLNRIDLSQKQPIKINGKYASEDMIKNYGGLCSQLFNEEKKYF